MMEMMVTNEKNVDVEKENLVNFTKSIFLLKSKFLL